MTEAPRKMLSLLKLLLDLDQLGLSNHSLPVEFAGVKLPQHLCCLVDAILGDKPTRRLWNEVHQHYGYNADASVYSKVEPPLVISVEVAEAQRSK